MIRIIKLGNLIYENIEVKKIDPETNTEIWNIPNDLTELKTALTDTLAWLEKRRLEEVLDRYQYNGLADVQFYAGQSDTEAQSILSWYSEYDNLIWSYIDNDLAAFTTVDELLQIDMKNIEQQIYEQSIKTAPLP